MRSEDMRAWTNMDAYAARVEQINRLEPPIVFRRRLGAGAGASARRSRSVSFLRLVGRRRGICARARRTITHGVPASGPTSRFIFSVRSTVAKPMRERNLAPL